MDVSGLRVYPSTPDPESPQAQPSWLRPSPLNDRPATTPCSIFMSYSPSGTQYGDDTTSLNQAGRAQTRRAQASATSTTIAAIQFGFQTRAAETAARAASEAKSESDAFAPSRQHGPRQLAEQPALKFVAPFRAKPKVHLGAPGRSIAKKPAASESLLAVPLTTSPTTSVDAEASATAGPAKRPAAAKGDVGASPGATPLRKSFAGCGPPSAKGGLLAAWGSTVRVWRICLGSQQMLGGSLEFQRMLWCYVKTKVVAAMDRRELPGPQDQVGPSTSREHLIAIYAHNKAEEWMATHGRKLQRAGIRIANRATTTRHGQAQGGKGKETKKGKGGGKVGDTTNLEEIDNYL